ncbi:glycoside hydrolase family 43 protein [Gracilibacillus timonensis]|uniref:glycoside hydrolase family 43 protein n=1 Tax=Gracilibacillus timonensis TaxID=1816696 RepID=UPI00082713F5|nr:glycoside hydrolase family 43 protein [Gracilibacillus timonensis]
MKYYNPVIKGFNPDPSICKVNDDYFLVASSFEYFPGIPIYHSVDLINWRQVGNCINRSSQLSFDNVSDSGGVWAPTIRYSNGVFYVTATMQNYGNFIITTNDIYKDWSDPMWVSMGGIDPSLYFEGTKAYFCTNYSKHKEKEEISMAEIDISTGELITDIKPIWSGTGGGFLEAPHLYHIGEWYYLLTAEGGTFSNHMATVARSRNIWGGYESCPLNPILTNRHDTSKEVQCTGHGDLVEDQNGNWWMIHLGTRLSRRTMTHLGREIFLTPIKWRDEWPVVVNNKKASLENEGELSEQQKVRQNWYANFKQKIWEPQWLFLRKPKNSSYHKVDGRLLLYPNSSSFDGELQPTFVGVRQADFICTINATYYFATSVVDDEAGVVFYLSSNFYYSISKRKTKQGDYLIVERVAEDFKQIAYKERIKDGKISLRIIADKQYYHFYCAIGEEPLRFVCKTSTRFLACEMAGKCFTGTVIALYALGNAFTNSVAKVESFSILT